MKAIKKGNYWYLQGTFYCELLERTRTYLFRDYNGAALPFVFKKMQKILLPLEKD